MYVYKIVHGSDFNKNGNLCPYGYEFFDAILKEMKM